MMGLLLGGACLALAWVWSVPTPRRAWVVRPYQQATVDPAVVLDLAVAAVRSGLSIPSALRALDVALGRGPDDVGELTRTSNLLLLGASWNEAWEGTHPGFRRLQDALRPAWEDGAAPVPMLERSAKTLRSSRVRLAKEAAAKLGEQLVLPLGLGFLPAFMILGVIPIIVSFVQRIF